MNTSIATNLNSLEENKYVNGIAIDIKFSKTTGNVLKKLFSIMAKSIVVIGRMGTGRIDEQYLARRDNRAEAYRWRMDM